MTLIYNLSKRLFILLIIYTLSRVFFYINNNDNFQESNILDLLNYNKPFLSFGKSMLKKSSWAVFYIQNKYYLVTENGIIENKLEDYVSYSNWTLKQQNEIKQTDINFLKAIKQTFNNRMIDNKLLYEN